MGSSLAPKRERKKKYSRQLFKILMQEKVIELDSIRI
jgi:hypothetical protein